MTTTRQVLLTALAGASAFSLLTGARGCSGGAGYGSTYAYDEYGTPVPVGTVVVEGGGGGYVGGPSNNYPVVVDVVGDLALTVYMPYDDGFSPFTESFSVTVREGSAYGPIIIEGSDFVFDGSGAGAVDLTDLPYALYDVEIVGYDLYGASVSYAAGTVSLGSPVEYLTLELENTAGSTPVVYEPEPVIVYQGDAVLDLVEPDGGINAAPTDTIDYYLWRWDAVTGEYVFFESVGYVTFDPYAPPVIASLDLGWYYLEVDAFDYDGFKNYTFAGEFEVAADLTTVPVWLEYAE